jgi:hypothetical protein
VSSQFLLPKSEVDVLRDLRGAGFDTIAARINNFAEQRHISNTMVAYRLYREGVIEHELWSGLAALYRNQWNGAREAQRERNRDREGGPNYYVVKRHRLGEALVSLARRMLAERAMSPSKAGKVLGVKPSNVYGLVSTDIGQLR